MLGLKWKNRRLSKWSGGDVGLAGPSCDFLLPDGTRWHLLFPSTYLCRHHTLNSCFLLHISLFYHFLSHMCTSPLMPPTNQGKRIEPLTVLLFLKSENRDLHFVFYLKSLCEEGATFWGGGCRQQQSLPLHLAPSLCGLFKKSGRGCTRKQQGE